jgi:D-threo-aldose 1-dehydrogenase
MDDGLNDTLCSRAASTAGEVSMGYEPTHRITVGRSAVSVTRLGFGCASIGGLYRSVAEETAVAVARHAWDLGIRYFDVAPLYGYGAAERRLGSAVRDRSRDDFAVSTKVGRLVRRLNDIRPGADVDPQALDGRTDAFYAGVGDRRMVFDFSASGVRRSVEESLERLGLDRVDILFIHDPDDHFQAAIEGAYPALHRMREEGLVGAIGAGMNQSEMLARFARETEIDVVLVAGRYTLLDQGALDELLPTCLERGISVVVGGVMNSGVLASPGPGASFDYRPAASALVERANRIREICDRHRVPLTTAAIQFPLAHPAVTALVAGVRTIDHLEAYPAAMRADIPAGLWSELRAERLLREDAPTP